MKPTDPSVLDELCRLLARRTSNEQRLAAAEVARELEALATAWPIPPADDESPEHPAALRAYQQAQEWTHIAQYFGRITQLTEDVARGYDEPRLV